MQTIKSDWNGENITTTLNNHNNNDDDRYIKNIYILLNIVGRRARG